ncbi:hypothetical protein L916_20236 [Phytophthora nicotianae]|uniref:Uncharacterized protein n=3 Tax=Phytophthora nicotianae TaxID=4792 RepID=W2HXU7_PHYNI|nr:hypothetical protein L916_20236 [Phytophthora nicotianae]
MLDYVKALNILPIEHADARLTGMAGRMRRYEDEEVERVASLEPLQGGTGYQV